MVMAEAPSLPAGQRTLEQTMMGHPNGGVIPEVVPARLSAGSKMSTVRPLIAIALLVVACGGIHAPTQAPLPIATVSGPTDTVYTDDQKTAMVAENIDIVYCGEEPKPDWCAKVHRVAGKPDVLVTGTSLFVQSTMASSATAKGIAKDMCSAIAAASFDDNAKPIGFYHVHIQDKAGDILADCNVAR